MKKTIILLILSSIFLTGCIKRDTLEDIDIYTTIYPIEYITDRLYGSHSNIYSIYPDGVNINDYTLTDKLIKDYSDCSLFVFNGISTEKDYVTSMYQNNKKIKIIDSTLSMEYANGFEELWLNPLNFLMMTQNIKTGFMQYISNHYLKNEIEEKYETLKLEISSLDAKIKLMAENAINKKIVVSNDALKFLEKYDIEVISLDKNSITDKIIANVDKLIKNNTIQYIFMFKGEESSEEINNLIKDTNVKLLYFNDLANLDEDERKTKEDYISIMNSNVNLLKEELYD